MLKQNFQNVFDLFFKSVFQCFSNFSEKGQNKQIKHHFQNMFPKQIFQNKIKTVSQTHLLKHYPKTFVLLKDHHFDYSNTVIY